MYQLNKRNIINRHHSNTVLTKDVAKMDQDSPCAKEDERARSLNLNTCTWTTLKIVKHIEILKINGEICDLKGVPTFKKYCKKINLFNLP